LVQELLTRARDARGQTFVEYGLVLAVVVVGVLLAATWTGLGAMLQIAMGAVAGAV
jgi:Flp pilus assembly pilin Flp